MAVRVLCTGDIHIGRSASKVPDAPRCSQAWTAIVDLAIAERVDLLAISGDIVDKENKSYEAIGPLQDGLRRLNEAGIDTVAIAGNHDHDVLPRLSGFAGTDRFHLLGSDGEWERWTLLRNGTPRLQVCGWSFPKEHVRENPLHTFMDGADDGVPVLGLLHAEVGNTRSLYAPVSFDDLRAHRVDFWLLGHIHAPRQYPDTNGCRALYPGSPFAMDPGEPDAHGVWMLTIEPGRPMVPEMIAISPVRYSQLNVDVTGIDDRDGFLERLTSELLATGRAGDGDHSAAHLLAVSCRIRLTGSSTAHRLIPIWATQARQDIDPYPAGRVSVFIDEITTDVRPHIPLDQLVRMNDALGATARLIAAMDATVPEPPYADLIRRTAAELSSVHTHPGYAAIRSGDQTDAPGRLTEDDARDLLRTEGWRLLSALLDQRDVA
jgi:DNA repair exonuclease SbcCD nuclease subunit